MVDMNCKNSFLEASADDLNNIFERLAIVSQLKGARNKGRRVETRAVEETPEPYVTEWEKEIRSHIERSEMYWVEAKKIQEDND